ncbi:nucleoside phosphorylase [Ekhidna sp.]|uniref:nucleoside phosphorylase n=1 Tax=Ekhidna sp. TaxID=2608089 RepID=UPI003B50A56F
MKIKPLSESELILNPDGSVYHICLRDEHVADTVLLVGDQDRVAQISRHFDHVEFQRKNREFVTHTGTYKGNRITVISTGIGTENIDIVVNELHAAVNIDLKTRIPKTNQRSLNLIRIGTSGALQSDMPVGSHVVSSYGLGFDGVLYYYNYAFDKKEAEITDAVRNHLQLDAKHSLPYVVSGSSGLVQQIGADMREGITATAIGFYGPQGRSIGLKLSIDDLQGMLQAFEFEGLRINNFEMETSALFGLGRLFGHHCCTCCVILANRITKDFLTDHDAAIDGLVETVLDRL